MAAVKIYLNDNIELDIRNYYTNYQTVLPIGFLLLLNIPHACAEVFICFFIYLI